MCAGWITVKKAFALRKHHPSGSDARQRGNGERESDAMCASPSSSNCVTVKPCAESTRREVDKRDKCEIRPRRPPPRRRRRSYAANTYGVPFVLWGSLSARCQTINAFSMYTARDAFTCKLCFLFSPSEHLQPERERTVLHARLSSAHRGKRLSLRHEKKLCEEIMSNILKRSCLSVKNTLDKYLRYFARIFVDRILSLP